MDPTQATWSLVIQAAAAFGTLAVACLAIWGNWVRSRLSGPRLRLSLVSSEGRVVSLSDGTPSRWYHLGVTNERRSAPARAVRVLVIKVSKPRADGAYQLEPMAGPLQITWNYPDQHLLYPTIGPEDICGFGSLTKGNGFRLSTYVVPNDLVGVLGPSDRMQVEFVAVADNAESRRLCLEIAWDGQWEGGSQEMAKHLVIKPVVQ